jgi:hypothetical protein
MLISIQDISSQIDILSIAKILYAFLNLFLQTLAMVSHLRLCSKCLFQPQFRNILLLTASSLPRVFTPSLPRNLSTGRHVSQKRQQDLDYFRNQPVVGNLQSNPYEHYEALRGSLPRNANSRRLNVAILGIPNSGKSTLINKAGSSVNLLETLQQYYT